MHNWKEKIIPITGIITFIILTLITLYNLEEKTLTYYTQIDNTKISTLTTNSDMKYEYKLTCYDKHGKAKTIKFKTVRELKNNAYLKLTYRYISGVNKWEEIEFTDLPTPVKEKYT